MSADVADREDIIREQFVLDGGVVVLDSWRPQGRNGPERVEGRGARRIGAIGFERRGRVRAARLRADANPVGRSEEHTSELQSHLNLVSRLLLEKQKTQNNSHSAAT